MKTFLILLLTAQSAFAYDVIISGNDVAFAKWKCTKKNFEKVAFTDKQRDDFVTINATNGVVTGDFANIVPDADTLAVVGEIQQNFNQLSNYQLEKELNERLSKTAILAEWTKTLAELQNQLPAKAALNYDISQSTTVLQQKLDGLKQRFINTTKP